MSGFVGVLNREEPVTDELLDRLWEPISHRGPDSTGRWRDGTLGVAAGVLRVSPESIEEEQPFRHESGVVVVFDGRLDNREELLSAFPSGAVVGKHHPDVVLVAEAYAAWGDRFPERLNGEYALAVLDPRRFRVILARDVIGTRTLHFTRTSAGDVVFGSEAKSLLIDQKVAGEPDLDVLAEYLLGGSARADQWHSFFAAVKRVPPGVTVLVAEGGLTWRTHDELDVQRKVRHASYQDYVDDYRERFVKAVGRRLRSDLPVGLLVSGGLDSSSILSVALTQTKGKGGLVPVHMAFPGSPGDEQPWVRQLERSLDIDIHRVVAEPDDLVEATAAQSFVLEAPVSSAGWASRIAAWDFMKERGAKSYLAGHWGDQLLFDQTYLVDLVDRLRWLTVWRHLRGFPDWMQGVPASYFRKAFLEDLIRWHLPGPLTGVARSLRTRLQGFHHETAWYTEAIRSRAAAPSLRPLIGGWSSTPIRSRLIQARLWGLTSGFAIAWNASAASAFGLAAGAPFLDRDLVSFLMSVPGEVVTSGGRIRGLHRDAMVGVLPESIRDRRDKGDGTALSNAEAIEAVPSIVELFSSGPVSGTMHLVHPDAVSAGTKSLEAQMASATDFQLGELVTRVVALEVWLRAFVEYHHSEELR